MHRSHIPNITFSTPQLSIIDPREVHHLKNVLRLKTGSHISIFNGQNEVADAVIRSLKPNEIELDILRVEKCQQDLPLITLACAIPKKGKFELIIEKATELGAYRIMPIMTAHSDVLLKNDQLHKKQLRYQTVAVNAAKQSKRLTVPEIVIPMGFQSAVDVLMTEGVALIPSLTGQPHPLLETLKTFDKGRNVGIVIGPEGDFSEKEYLYAKNKGCIPVSLGKNILKVETAAITAVALIKLYFNP